MATLPNTSVDEGIPAPSTSTLNQRSPYGRSLTVRYLAVSQEPLTIPRTYPDVGPFQLCNHNTPDTISTMAEGFNGMAMDQPAGSSRTNPYAAESWLEPWLIKHSGFYRKHLTRGGRRESKSTRRHSIVAEGLESRKNSVAVPEAEAAATDAIPALAEEPRRSVESDTSEA
ncbi:hypothetical protein LTR47_009326 [Exophiala xenobiotica]|nr:hypothetical protein LTR47_009326 [Exophiala xenobiotica]KAK5343151.1 hypothetical protein LTR98_000780 [Exophiala xenobiotica]KAK5540732.1 hypothetical protein LTR23_005963 [Chaetothyriales sp. CCFEE 6169]